MVIGLFSMLFRFLGKNKNVSWGDSIEVKALVLIMAVVIIVVCILGPQMGAPRPQTPYVVPEHYQVCVVLPHPPQKIMYI